MALVLGILLIGTVGYRLVSHGASSWLDCLYMVVITVATIGYEEVVPLDHSPGGRVFTMVVALFGIGIITYVMTTITQVAVDGDLQRRWRRRRMQKAIEELEGHYILCGWGPLSPQIARELEQTQRTLVVVAPNPEVVAVEMGEQSPTYIIEGDPTDDDALQRAGIMRAAGVFAADKDDHANIVICMSARGLRPEVKVVAQVSDVRLISKMRKAGAASVISPTSIGALRMSSEMVRPSVVSFLDVMLRDRDRNLRVEDVAVGPGLAGATVASLALDHFENTVLLATRRGDAWVFKPRADHTLAAGDVLIVMTNPAERQKLADALK